MESPPQVSASASVWKRLGYCRVSGNPVLVALGLGSRQHSLTFSLLSSLAFNERGGRKLGTAGSVETAVRARKARTEQASKANATTRAVMPRIASSRSNARHTRWRRSKALRLYGISRSRRG